MRSLLAGLLGLALLAASCGSPGVTPGPASPVSPGATHPSSLMRPSPTATASTPAASATTAPTPASPATTPRPTPVPFAPAIDVRTGEWAATDGPALARADTHALLMGDGRVLVVGNDIDTDCVRADSRRTETWDPGTGRWSRGPSLNKARADFAAVTLADGRPLVTGGVNAASATSGHQSYSSTYVLDPWDTGAGWVRGALLDTARTSPAYAALRDGRVLVAGGYYLSGTEVPTGASGITLAACRTGPGSDSASSPPRLGDTGPPPTMVPAIATAELYDPMTDRWSPTGHMRYARVDPLTVTLADGRVLVVGTASPNRDFWNYTYLNTSERAAASAELFDPATGRFVLTGSLPPMVGSGTDTDLMDATSRGRLVALADGDALLVGRAARFDIRVGDDYPVIEIVESLRFQPDDGSWRIVDRHVLGCPARATCAPETPGDGHAWPGAAAVLLGDGKVLVAGGMDGTTETAVARAALYDPAADRWTALPRMPAARSDAAAVRLADGSVLITGGRRSPSLDCGDGHVCCFEDDEPGVPGAVRFVPRS